MYHHRDFYQINWTAISAIISALSAGVLAWTATLINKQAQANEKYTEYSIMPNAFFFLKTTGELFPNQLPQTKLIAINNAKFPIWFRIKIDFKASGRSIVPQHYYWDKPLYLYPGQWEFPAPFDKISEFDKLETISDAKIVAQIWYSYSPVFAPEEESRVYKEPDWILNIVKNEWEGPNGIESKNIKL